MLLRPVARTHASNSFSNPPFLATNLLLKRLVQEKLGVRLVPDALVVRKLASRGNVFASQPNGHGKKFLLSLSLAQDLTQGDRVAFAYRKTQVRFDFRTVLFPPGHRCFFPLERRN